MVEQTEQAKQAGKRRQQWSQTRNTLRFRLGGATRNIEGVLESPVLTAQERKELEALTARLRRTLSRWPGRNEESKAGWMREPKQA